MAEDHLQTCNMDERTNEEKLKDYINELECKLTDCMEATRLETKESCAKIAEDSLKNTAFHRIEHYKMASYIAHMIRNR